MTTSFNEYSSSHLIQALEDLETTEIFGVNLDDEYLDMLNHFTNNPQFITQNFPESYEDLQNSYDKNKIIDFIGYLGIDVGFGGDTEMTQTFKSYLEASKRRGLTGY